MYTVKIETDLPYNVLIGENLLPEIACHISAVQKPCKIGIITDSNVAPLYASTVKNSLENGGFSVEVFIFSAGEASKNSYTLLQILSFLATHDFSRSDCLLALGGGVCGDICALAASLYMRGIRLISVPTTLLSAVDSSIGGKTAINLPQGKNLIGTFYQPSLVLCDIATLQTLSKREFSNGIAEAIKCGAIGSEPLFNLVKSDGFSNKTAEIIRLCVELKGKLVSQDTNDFGARRLLNFGHTAAHAIEKCSDFSIPHGSAVSIGMCIASNYAAKIGFCDFACHSSISALLQKFKLPISCNFSPSSLATAALADKKRSGDKITLILPKAIGDCRLFEIDLKELPNFFSIGTETAKAGEKI